MNTIFLLRYFLKLIGILSYGSFLSCSLHYFFNCVTFITQHHACFTTEEERRWNLFHTKNQCKLFLSAMNKLSMISTAIYLKVWSGRGELGISCVLVYTELWHGSLSTCSDMKQMLNSHLTTETMHVPYLLLQVAFLGTGIEKHPQINLFRAQ